MATLAPEGAPQANPASEMELWQRILAFALMAFGMFMAVLDIQIVAGSLAQIQAGLSASADEIVWVQTAYLIAETVMIPLSSFLSRWLSIRWAFTMSCAAFTVTSMLCASATTIEEMIVYRALQGFVGGAMIPSVYATTFLAFGRDNANKAMGIIALIVTMAPTVGPTLGGWVTDTFSWHWLFLINIVPGIIVTIGVATFGKFDTGEKGLIRRIDLPGLVLMALFLGGLSFVLEEGSRNDWFDDGAIRLWSLIALIAAVGFFWRVTTAKEPILRLDAFGNLNFAAGTFMSIVAGVALFGLIYIYPVFLARVGHLSSTQIGGILAGTGAAMFFTGIAMNQFRNHLRARHMIAAGFLLLALSTWMTSQLDAEWRFNEMFWPQILRGIGLMMVIASIMASSFTTLPPHQLKDAASLLTLLRNLGGATGIALLNTLLLIRFNFHWSRLAEAINPARDEVLARLDLLRGLGIEQGLADPEASALRAIGADVAEQALVMSFADCFYLLSLLFLLAAAIPLLLKGGTDDRLGAGH